MLIYVNWMYAAKIRVKTYIRQLEVHLQRQRQKRFFASFLIGFTSFVVLFFEHGVYFPSIGGTIAKIQVKKFIRPLRNWVYYIPTSIFRQWRLIYVYQKYSCQDTCKNVYSPAFKLGISRLLFKFLNIGNFLCRLEVSLPRYRRISLYFGFKIRFTVFSILYLDHWRLFCVDLRYSCKDSGNNVYSPALKLNLRHLPFYFQNIGSYFLSIGVTVAKIRAKLFILML